ncbi:MAG TPA: glycosyltransferase [Candidatus Acidoferrum sp.]|nr:glycosyltransferase [Candidatus Acidoferrum sp.]
MTPLISVIIDTYNHERFIEDAIRSVLDQDFPRSQMEILVVDDGSTDRTPEIVRKFEPQVRLLRKQNGGQASSINYGVAKSRGEFVAFLDGDDVWLPNKLSRVVAEFRSHPEAVMVYHKFSFRDPRDGREWEPGWIGVSGDIVADPRKLHAYGAAPTSSLAFRRQALERIIPIPDALVFMADAFLIATVIFLGPVVAVPESLAKNCVHGHNLWFVEAHKPDPNVLRRRVEMREAAIKGLRDWTDKNAPGPALRQVRYFLRRWRLIQDNDEFQFEAPGRLKEFVHLCRQPLVDQPAYSRIWLAYSWLHAFAFLIFGKHAHYLEGVRTRVSNLKRRLQGRIVADQSGETAGHG